MFKILFNSLSLINLLYTSLSQEIMVGGQMDTHNCLIGAGYTWCESSQNCIRQWLEPCSDNYLDCDDCLKKQRKGINIACPRECDNYHAPCPEVMCAMYCENGFEQDKNGCDICICNEPFIAIDPMPPVINPQPVPAPASDSCEIPYEDCDNLYACPKVTEITQCSEGGLDEYTTYRLSIILKPNMNIKNIYALYGSEDSQENTHMLIPGSKQIENAFGSNLGGVSDNIININPDSAFDSWITIGVTDGNIHNDINSIGIDYDKWDELHDIDIDNGAVFLMDPDTLMVNNEIIIGQFTIRTGSIKRGKINIQGKFLTNYGNVADNSWKQENIEFVLNQPNILSNGIPTNCDTWYDGCNTCRVSNGVIGACTRMMCFREETPYCMSFNSGH
jgi:hypothetical protein